MLTRTYLRRLPWKIQTRFLGKVTLSYFVSTRSTLVPIQGTGDAKINRAQALPSASASQGLGEASPQSRRSNSFGIRKMRIQISALLI